MDFDGVEILGSGVNADGYKSVMLEEENRCALRLGLGFAQR